MSESRLRKHLDKCEALYIYIVLKEAKGRIPKAAEALGIGLSSLYRKMQKYSIKRRSYKHVRKRKH